MAFIQNSKKKKKKEKEKFLTRINTKWSIKLNCLSNSLPKGPDSQYHNLGTDIRFPKYLSNIFPHLVFMTVSSLP